MEQLRALGLRLLFFCFVTMVGSCAEETSAPDTPATVALQALVGRGAVPSTTSAPVIDGSLEADWSAVDTQTATRVLTGPAVTPPDLGMTWKAMWDPAAVYFFIQVSDDTGRRDSPQAWDDDAIELFLDADNSHGTSYDGRNDFQFLFRPGSTTVEFGTRSVRNSTGVRVATVARSGGYTMEVAIPWATLGVSARPGQKLGVDLHVDDDDDGGARDGKLATFASRDDSWTNPSLFGVLALGAPAADFVPITGTSRTPRIDAVVEAESWGTAPVRPIVQDLLRNRPGPQSVSGSWQTIWDAQALYFMVQVSDDVPMGGAASPWDDDSVEIFIDGDNSRGTRYDGRNDFQLFFRLDDATLRLGSNSAQNVAGVSFSMVRTSSAEYRLEVAVPWSVLGVTPTAGAAIGVDVQVNDDDDGGTRDGKIATFNTADDSWSNPSKFEPLVLDAMPPPSCSVDRGRELLIRDLSVVEDPVRTRFDGPASDPRVGAWTFGRLAEQLAPSPAQAPALVEQLFRSWQVDQSVNSFNVRARPSVQGFVLNSWPRSADGQLDLTRSPLLLLAIVNRIDLRDVALGRAGEGRFVFGVLSPQGIPMSFTVIVEYRLPAASTADVLDWANRWHALGALPFPSETYNAALQALTSRFSGRGAEPGRVNGSALGQLRTNEIALFAPWELREFELSASDGMLRASTVKLTPDDSFLFGGPLIDAFVNQNEATILAQQHTLPLTFQGASFLGGASSNRPSFWSSTGIVNPEARHLFSLNTCNGCHGNETSTAFLHVFPRSPGQIAQLSNFMNGDFPSSDPVTGQQRTFADLERRVTDLQRIVCPAPSLSRVASSARDGFLAKGIGRVH